MTTTVLFRICAVLCRIAYIRCLFLLLHQWSAGWNDYTAMQSGVIDGAENNETALTVGGHGEVAKCYSYDEHTRIPDIVLISTKVWNKFSAEQQEIVQAAADAAKETYKADWQAAIEQAVKDAETNMGVTFYHPDSLAPFQEAVQPIYDRLAKEEPEVWALCEKIQAFQA